MTSTFLVIGASTGLGAATAVRLATRGRVVVAGRHPGADVRVDLRDLADLARAAQELSARGPYQGVVCNAGIQHRGAVRTPDGLDETFAVNHLGHFALIHHLVPALAAGARVAFIGSGTLDPDNRGARRFGFRGARYTTAREVAMGAGDPTVTPAQRGRDAYATSKLCNVLTVRALARRVAPARFSTFTFDPGLMAGTKLARNYNVLMRALAATALHLVARLLPGGSSVRRSSAALTSLLTEGSIESGAYYDFRRRRIEALPAVATRDDWADDLYATSLELTGLSRVALAG